MGDSLGIVRQPTGKVPINARRCTARRWTTQTPRDTQARPLTSRTKKTLACLALSVLLLLACATQVVPGYGERLDPQLVQHTLDLLQP